MPKAGRYDYPANDLEYCIEKLRKIIEVCKADTIKREVAADALGMAIRGGATSSLFASMAIYGLVETHEGELRITELGKSIIFGEPDEVERAKGESVRKVALFADIFDQYGANVTEEQLRIFLRQKAYVDVAKVQSLTNIIGNIFKKVAIHLKSAEVAKPVEVAPTVGRREITMPEEAIPKEVLGELRTTDYGVLKIKDILSADLAMKIIEGLKAKLQAKAEEKGR